MSKARRILLCSLGLSPQVITETVYALDQLHDWQPEHLILLTTRAGAKVGKSLLLHPRDGALVAYGREWNAPWAKDLAASAQLEVLETDTGDLDGARWLMAFADMAVARISEITSREDTQLHVSLAGGRKPQAAILALALAMFGRPQDKLSHVLTSEEAASNPAFFYPTRNAKPLATASGSVMDARNVPVQLIDIPFPRLPGQRADASRGFVLAAAETSFPKGARLIIDTAESQIGWDGLPLQLPPALAAWLAWLASHQVSSGTGLPRVGASRKGYLESYEHFVRSRRELDRARARLSDPLDPEWMEEKVARINKLAMGCGIQPRGAMLVQRVGGRARAIYRLALDTNEIEIRTRAQSG